MYDGRLSVYIHMSPQRTERYEVYQVTFPSSDRPKPGILQIMTALDGTPEAARFLCPCGCGEQIYLPLVKPELNGVQINPRWDYRKGGYLVHPSIQRLDGCQSHFWIREDGVVVW